jgi:hypothetical protein
MERLNCSKGKEKGTRKVIDDGSDNYTGGASDIVRSRISEVAYDSCFLCFTLYPNIFHFNIS